MTKSSIQGRDPAVEHHLLEGPLEGNEREEKLAQKLDAYAVALESGNARAADELLKEFPDLEARLGGHLSSLRRLCQVRKVAADDQVSRHTGQPEEAFVPSNLGDYQLRREIGRGGMGVVYEATQISLRRNVAVKVLPFAAVLDQTQIKRFRNEAHAAASLHHPHIVPVFGVGCERGVHYYSMQLINGQSLEQMQQARRATAIDKRVDRLRAENEGQVKGDTTTQEGHVRRVFPPADLGGQAICDPSTGTGSTEANVGQTNSTISSRSNRNFIRNEVRLVIAVAEALDYAHEQGVIHRDIKPSNLLLDENGKIWVADFGLARCRSVGNLTAEGSLMGTIRYMSPEQVAAKPRGVDHRSDIYSLGITLYELLTSHAAFTGRNREQLMRAVECDMPTSPRRLNPAIPIDLETVLLKAIAKDKDDRYQTAGEFAADLKRFLDGRPTLARRPTLVDQGFKWAMRRKSLVISLLACLVFSCVLLAITSIAIAARTREVDAANLRAQHHLRQAHAAVYRFGSLVDEHSRNLRQTRPLRRDVLLESQRFYADFLRYTEGDSQYAREAAHARYRLGAVLASIDDREKALRTYRLAIRQYLALREQHPFDGRLHGDLALCLNNLAKLKRDCGRDAEAVRAYRQAIGYQREAIQLNPANLDLVAERAATQTNLATALIEIGEEKEGKELLELATGQLSDTIADAKSSPSVNAQWIETRNSLAATLMTEDAARAERLLRETIETLESHAKETSNPPTTVLNHVCQLSVARNNLAALLGTKGEFDEALQLTRSAAGELEKHGSDTAFHTQLAIVLNNQGQLLYQAGYPIVAKESFARAAELFRGLFEATEETATLCNRLAGVLHNQATLDHAEGNHVTAKSRLAEAIELQTRAIQQAPLNRSYRQCLAYHREMMRQFSKHDSKPNALLNSLTTTGDPE